MKPNTIEINGTQYILASRLTRLLAQFLDALIPGVLLILLIVFGVGTTAVGIYILLFLLYLFFQDGLPNGQSLGKKIVSIKVISEKTGANCNYIRSLMRNGTLVVLGYIDLLFILGKKKQRLGDMIGKTIVVEIQKKSQLK